MLLSASPSTSPYIPVLFNQTLGIQEEILVKVSVEPKRIVLLDPQLIQTPVPPLVKVPVNTHIVYVISLSIFT